MGMVRAADASLLTQMADPAVHARRVSLLVKGGEDAGFDQLTPHGDAAANAVARD